MKRSGLLAIGLLFTLGLLAQQYDYKKEIKRNK